MMWLSFFQSPSAWLLHSDFVLFLYTDISFKATLCSQTSEVEQNKYILGAVRGLFLPNKTIDFSTCMQTIHAWKPSAFPPGEDFWWPVEQKAIRTDTGEPQEGLI